MRIFDFPLAELKPIWAPVAWVSLLSNILLLVPTLYMLQIFDRVLPSNNEWTLIFLSTITLFLYAVLSASEWLRTRMLINASVRFEQQAWPAIFKDQIGITAVNSTGWQPEWITRLSEVRQFLSGPSLLVAIDLCFTPIFVGVLYILHPWLAAFALLMMALQFALAQITHQQAGNAHRKLTQAWQHESHILRVGLRHFETALALGLQPILKKRWRQARDQALEASKQQQTRDNQTSSIGKFVRYTQQSLGLSIGAWLVIRGELSPGAMIAANVLTTRSLGPIEQWATSWSQIMLGVESYQKLEKLVHNSHTDTPTHTNQDSPTPQPWTLHQLLLLIEGRPQPVICPLSLTISPTEITALCGPSGAGKSSLLKAMLGQWPAQHQKGQIKLGPHPVNTQYWLSHGHKVGYLPQTVELFQATISENIARMQRPDSEQVISVAKKVGIHEQILALPNGYDTRMDGHFALSNGLRRRIGLARALYGNPQWLLLDEPSASLDQASTQQLLLTLRALCSEGIGIIYSTHNPQLIEMADRRLRLQSGVLKAT